MNIDKLMNALDNDANESIMNLTTKKVMELNLLYKFLICQYANL